MDGLGFAIDLRMRVRPGATVPAPTSTITSMSVLAADGLHAEDGTTAADANGWVARVVLPDIGDVPFDPTKIVLTVTDPGFDAAGAATTVTRTLTGTAILRKQHPNRTVRLNSASGGARTVYFALSDVIYAGSTATAVATEGYYGTVTAGAVPAPVNASTRAYPKPGFAWVSMQNEREAGASIYVEGYAAHRHARGGRQVACVRYQARDAQATPNLTAEIAASAPVLSTMQIQGQRAEVYAATIGLAGLANGDRCRMNARVFPWIGDASAVLDLIADGVGVSGAATSANAQTPLRFTCDRTGGYGGNAAWVKAAASGGAVNDRNAPFPTIGAAFAALATANAAKGHADHSGSDIFLMDDGAGGAVAHTIAANVTTAAGNCWTNIRPDPLAVGAVSLSLPAANRQVPNLTRFFVNVAQNSGTLDGTGGAPPDRAIAFENMTLHVAGATSPINWRNPLCYLRNVTVTGLGNAGANPFTPLANNAFSKIAQMVGVVCTDATIGVPVRAYSVIGCTFRRAFFDELDTIAFAAFEPQDGAIVANTIFGQVIDGGARTLGRTRPIARGYWVIQNVWEATRTTNTNYIFGVSCDNSVQPVDNVVLMHNSFPATDITGRCNFLYMDEAGDVGVIKRAHFHGNIFGQWNCKSDTFTDNSSVAGRTGNWSVRYGVGQEGNVCMGDTGGNTAANPEAPPTHWLDEARTASNKLNATPAGLTYVDQKAGLNAAGGGNYRLTGASNDAYGRVAEGRAVLAFDLAGIARLNSGAGAAGAYERTG